MTRFRHWLIRLLGGTATHCDHKWEILIEHYPDYVSDMWSCARCSVSRVFANDAPPVKLERAICDLGDVHIINGLNVDPQRVNRL